MQEGWTRPVDGPAAAAGDDPAGLCPVPLRRLVLFVVAYALALFVFNGLYAIGPVFEAVLVIHRASAGLVHPTLLGSGACVLVLIVGIGMGLMQLPAASFGWRLRLIVPAFLATLALWLVAQGVLLVLSLARHDLPQLHESWAGHGATFLLGALLGQVLGNALVEESAVRAFILEQVRLRRLRRGGRLQAVLLAIVISSLIFAVAHLPNRLFLKDYAPADLLPDQARLVMFGVIFAGLWLVWRNVFFCTGVHALWNEPVPIVDVHNMDTARIVTALLTIAAIAAIPLGRHLRHKPAVPRVRPR